MQHAGVVPDHQVADLPLVAVDAIRRRRPRQQAVEEGSPLGRLHPDDALGRGTEDERAAARKVRPHEGVHLGGPLAPQLHLLGRGVRVDQSLRRFERVNHPDRREALLLLVGEVVVGGVRAGELGLAARRGDGVGCKEGRHDGNVLGQPVDVPVERAPQVAGRPVLRGVEGHSEDLRVLALAEDLDPPQPLAERHLGGVVEVKAAEDEHAVLLQRLQRPCRQRLVAEQSRGVDVRHLGPDRRRQLLDGDHGAEYPPSTTTAEPVVQLDASLARYA